MIAARKSHIFRTILLFIMVFFICFPAQAQYGGGSGTGDDPYQIWTDEQMNAIGSDPNDWDKHFKLMADIDLTQYTGEEFNIIGTDFDICFSGVFDGQGHIISNFTWDDAGRKHVGLFGCIKGAEIKDLGLESVSINTPDCNNVGGLVGNNDWFCTISGCYVSGSVTGKDKVGLLVGYNMAVVSNSYSQGSVSGNKRVGGLVGDNVDGAVINCYSISSVSGNSKVGGLLGAGGRVTNSFWDVEVSGRLTSAGGSGKTTIQMKTADTYLGWSGCDSESFWTLDEGNDYPRLGWEAKSGQPLPQQELSDFLTGTGTQAAPYLVSTGRQLYLIGLFPCEWDKHFVLTNDVNLADCAGTEFNIIGTNWLHTFTGVLDGMGHRIINFSWYGTDQYDVGLIGYLGGEIKNLGLETVDVNAPDCDRVGGLVGFNRGIISDSYVVGDIFGYSRVGGLAGSNYARQAGSNIGVIHHCHTIGSVSGDNRIGGLVGENNDESMISDSYSLSDVSGEINIGGLVGHNIANSAISDSYASGNVSGDRNVGGLAGSNENNSTISGSYATGSVSGDSLIGGLVGENNNQSAIINSSASSSVAGNGDYIGGFVGLNSQGAIFNSCSKGGVSGDDDVGGLVGNDLYGTISNSYSEGTVDGHASVGGLVGSLNGTIYNSYSACFVLGSEYVGGLVGGNAETSVISNSFWDVQISGQSSMCGKQHSPGCINTFGKTTTEMQTASTFLGAGWDFVDEIANGPHDIWWMPENDYPKLWWERSGKYGGGTGEPNDPYLIFTAEHLNTVGAESNDWDKHFKLMADIDLSGYSYDTALIAPDVDPCDLAFQGTSFTGIFDGNGCTVSNLTITGTNYLGLFGRLESAAEIKNLGVVDVNIAGSDYLGGLVGFSRGSIARSYCTGSISGDRFLGGLTGRNWLSIIECFSTAAVTGSDDVGGLAGGNYGSITDSYSTGAITSNWDVGGLVGANSGYISSSYSTGMVTGISRTGGLVGNNWDDDSVTSSFWDVETSGLATSNGGTGKTTAEMQMESTFTDAGWDFVEETANGTEEIWWILEGRDYPRLWWEQIPEN